MQYSVSISIHALLAESDAGRIKTNPDITDFYPRSPCGERHQQTAYFFCAKAFLSTLSLRRATAHPITILVRVVEISIHALLAESDTPSTFRHCTTYLFLSTLSLRRATSVARVATTVETDFYPRSPCGERLFILRKITITVDISIHALLAESDSRRAGIGEQIKNFYPRSPCGERPLCLSICE